MDIILIGFGTVGKGLAQILRDKADDLRAQQGFEARIVGGDDVAQHSTGLRRITARRRRCADATREQRRENYCKCASMNHRSLSMERDTPVKRSAVSLSPDSSAALMASRTSLP